MAKVLQLGSSPFVAFNDGIINYYIAISFLLFHPRLSSWKFHLAAKTLVWDGGQNKGKRNYYYF